MEILINIGVALLGIVFFTVWNVRKHIKSFSINILWKDNRGYFLWAFVVVVLVSSISSIVPDSRAALKMLTGIDLEFSTVGYLTLGIILSGLSKKKGDKSIGAGGVDTGEGDNG